uniref:Cytochrome P450 n=1 Tax=Oryza meridionalis TaxID=40149 RepID=A0A0E0CY14_9ORYZ
MELLLLYAPCVILLVSSLYLLRLFADARRNLPPGPRPLPLVGNLLELGAKPHRSLARLAERHGPLMTLRLGAVTTIVASSPDAARDILQRHDAAFSTRPVPDIVRACGHDRFAMPWLPPSSPQWRALRKVCSAELFAPRRAASTRSSASAARRRAGSCRTSRGWRARARPSTSAASCSRPC